MFRTTPSLTCPTLFPIPNLPTAHVVASNMDNRIFRRNKKLEAINCNSEVAFVWCSTRASLIDPKSFRFSAKSLYRFHSRLGIQEGDDATKYLLEYTRKNKKLWAILVPFVWCDTSKSIPPSSIDATHQSHHFLTMVNTSEAQGARVSRFRAK